MPVQAPLRRARGLSSDLPALATATGPLRCQVLWHRFEVEADDLDVRAQLALMFQAATHDIAPATSARIQVTGDPSAGYEVLDNGDLLARVATAREVLDEVFARCHRRAFELASLRGWVRFHGAVASIDGFRFALVGPSGAGKTTLAAALLSSGASVETDESFVAREGQVVSVARRLHVKAGTAAIGADLSWSAEAPVLDGDPPLHVVDPTEHGFEWHLPTGSLDAVVLVDRTDSPSSVQPIGASTAVQRLIAESFPVVESRASIVRQASALVRGTSTFVVHNGADTRAVDLIIALATDPPARPGPPRDQNRFHRR